jgi:hypothetical protein
VAEIWHDEAAGAWLVEMRSTAYAFGLAEGLALPRETASTFGSTLVHLVRLSRD